MTFRVALVQPLTHRPPDDAANVADCVAHIAEAAREGADFVCFPETYPGPWRMPATFDPVPALVEAAAKHRVHAIFGAVSVRSTGGGAHNLICMAYPDGGAVARSRRTHPNGPVDLRGRPQLGLPLRSRRRLSGLQYRVR